MNRSPNRYHIVIILLLFLISIACGISPRETETPPPAATNTIPVINTQPPQQPTENVTASLTITSGTGVYAPGESIEIAFTAPASFMQDAWIGIIPSSIAHGSEAENDLNDLDYQYLMGQSSGTMTFNAPAEPGQYDFRMHDTDDNGVEVASASFTVEAASQPTGLLVDCQGVTLYYDPALATSLSCSTVPAETNDPIEWSYPEHRQLGFNGYPLSDTFHQPKILVYPVAVYASMNPTFPTGFSELQNIIATKPDQPDRIPFFPVWNAAQMIRSQIEYLDFENGSGVRFLTMYGQSFYPVNNRHVFYAFQGITADGQYVVSAILPVSNPVLPATENDIPGGDFDAFAANFTTYIEETRVLLNSQADSTFSPDLQMLDDMIMSITVAAP